MSVSKNYYYFQLVKILGHDRIPEFREAYINEEKIGLALDFRHHDEVELSLFDAKNTQLSLNSDNSKEIKSEGKTG